MEEVSAMRTHPADATARLWHRPIAARIQWGCVLMQLLGEQSLEHLHLVLAGYQSVEHSRQVNSYEQAVRTARMLLGNLLTKQAVQNAVDDFLDMVNGFGVADAEDDTAQSEHVSFDINPDTLRFTPRYAPGLDPNIEQATTIMMHDLGRAASERVVADTERDLVAMLGPDARVKLRMQGMRFPAMRQHERTSRPQEPIHIPINELCQLAADLDQEDRDAQRQSRSWTSRMEQVRKHLRQPTGQGLREATTLDLTGLRHLIGLPGSGKSTLIELLCVYLARQGKRVAVFFTSIEVARQYLERLHCYSVPTGILVGRSGMTHRRHANDLAELIASQGNGGFGHWREGADLFATSCPLPAFAEEWPSDEEWPLGEAPCESLLQVGDQKKQRLLCPAWQLCGRVKNQRELVDARVWVGHIRSADTLVPAHTATERLRYFELIAETFDLVVFDECDITQKVLDDYGSVPLQFIGDNEQSLHAKLQHVTGLLAANRTRFSEPMLRYVLRANEFERHTLRFLAMLRQLWQQPRTQRLARDYSDKLLTSHFLIRLALRKNTTWANYEGGPLGALAAFWDWAVYHAFFQRNEEAREWPKANYYAKRLGLQPNEAAWLSDRWCKVTQELKKYLMQDHASKAEETIQQIAAILAEVFRVPSAESILDHVRLLIAVSFTLASYQALAREARPMVQRGEIPADEQSAFLARASSELRKYVPRSLLGTFSAVRYRRAAEGNGFEIDYFVMDLTPRVLLHRLHEMGRKPHVLLASATSWLPASSEYHINKRPDYVLTPPEHGNTGAQGQVRLHVRTLPHPTTGLPLRFSGANSERERNLQHMVAALARPDLHTNLSELERAVAAMTTPTRKRRRKVALVVNSYDQVRLVVDHLHDVHPNLGRRTRGVLREMLRGADADRLRERYVLRGQVEDLGRNDDVDVIVFPMEALGRGVNIVYHTTDEDDGRGAIGSLYFLTRPHPAAGDLGLLTSLLARDTAIFDLEDLRNCSIAEASERYKTRQYALYRAVTNLLARPLSASRLHADILTTFAANLLVSILQAIGRGMRKGMPVQVYFVDAAWAEGSARGLPETKRSSLLVQMRDILNACLDNPDPDLRDVYEALYGIFATAFDNIEGLILPEDGGINDVELFDPSPVTSEIEFDDAISDTALYYPPSEEDLPSRSPAGFDDRDDSAGANLESELDYYFAAATVPASSATATSSEAFDDEHDSEEED